MKTPTASIVLSLITVLTASAVVMEPAPNFTFEGAGGKAASLKSLRGQPVVLLIATSPRDRRFRSQVKKLAGRYRQFASRNAVFFAAFRQNPELPQSDIPFAVAVNGAKVANDYGIGDAPFALVVIGKDGNIDLKTTKVYGPERVQDVIDNSYVVQAGQRKEQ